MKIGALHSRFRMGFSILETLIVVALFAVVLIALFNIILSHYTIFATQQATVDVANSARSIMSEVNAAALPADHIVSSHTFSGTNYTTGGSTVIFEVPSIDSAGNTIGGSYDYVCVTAVGATANLLTDAASGSARLSGVRQLTNVLSTLTFTYDNADPAAATKITVDVETQERVKNQTLHAHLNQQVYLRNL